MKRVFSAILCLALMVGLMSSCSPAAQMPIESQPPTPAASPAATPTPEPTPSPADFDTIEITAELDDVMMQAIVTVKNTGTKTFNGDIHVYLYDSANTKIGYDMIFVEDLTAGNSTFARLAVTSTDADSFDYSFADGCTFTDGAPSSGGELDQDASSKITADMSDFSMTSWYGYIVKIEVYNTDESNYAIVTVNTADSDAIDRIGNAVFGNHQKEYSLSRVSVQDESGTELFTRDQ